MLWETDRWLAEYVKHAEPEPETGDKAARGVVPRFDKPQEP
jgi:hypothetical protein